MEEIKNYPKKIKIGRRKDNIDGLVTFFRKGYLKKFYISSYGDTKEITFEQAIDYIKDDKVSVGIFPEGKRGTELQEFKPGAFKIAEKARCPLVVCSMKGTTDIHKNWPWKRTDVYMDVLEVINPSVWNDKTTVDVSNYAHEIIYNDLYNKSNQTKRGTV